MLGNLQNAYYCLIPESEIIFLQTTQSYCGENKKTLLNLKCSGIFG